MINLVRKYAKDLNPGDKINCHEKGWLTVKTMDRIPLTLKTKILFENGDNVIMDSHTLFENVVVEN